MRQAKNLKTHQLYYAYANDNELTRLSNFGQLICPCCEENVYYFSGSVKVSSHFKHHRGVGSISCENYVEGFNSNYEPHSNKHRAQHTSNSAHINKQVEIDCKLVKKANDTVYASLCITLKPFPKNATTPVTISLTDSKNSQSVILQRDTAVKKSFSISLPLRSPINIENCNCSSTIDYVAYVSELLEQHSVFPLKIENAKECSILFRRKLFIDEIDAVFDTEASFTNMITYRTEANEFAIKTILMEDGFDIKVGFAEEYCVYSPHLTNYSDSTFYFSQLTELSIFAFRSTKLVLEIYGDQRKLDSYVLDIKIGNEQSIKIIETASRIKCTNQLGITRWFIQSREPVDILDTKFDPNETLEYSVLNGTHKVCFKRNDGLWSSFNTRLEKSLKDQATLFISKGSWNNANLENGF